MAYWVYQLQEAKHVSATGKRQTDVAEICAIVQKYTHLPYTEE